MARSLTSSGIRIPVELDTQRAKQDLAKLSNDFASVLKQANQGFRAIGTDNAALIDLRKFATAITQIQAQAAKAKDAIDAMGRSGALTGLISTSEEASGAFGRLAGKIGLTTTELGSFYKQITEKQALTEQVNALKQFETTIGGSREAVLKFANAVGVSQQAITAYKSQSKLFDLRDWDLAVAKVKQYDEAVTLSADSVRALAAGVQQTARNSRQLEAFSTYFKNAQGDIALFTRAMRQAGESSKSIGEFLKQNLSGAKSSVDDVRKSLEALNPMLKNNQIEFDRTVQAVKRFADEEKRFAQVQGFARLVNNDIAALRRLSAQFGLTERDISQFERRLANIGRSQINLGGSRLASSLQGTLSSLTASLGAPLGVYGLVEFGKAAAKTAMEMEAVTTAFRSIYGSADKAGEKLSYIKSVTDELGISYLTAAKEAKKLYASAEAANLSDSADKIFKSFTNAGTALHLTSQEMGSVYLAVSQILSKGKVQAEEITQQLSERLPGATSMLARSIGVTGQQLSKMFQRGEVTLDHFMQFVDYLNVRYEEAAKKSAHTAQAELQRVQSAWDNLKTSITDTSGLADAFAWVASALNSVTDAVNSLSGVDFSALQELVKLIGAGGLAAAAGMAGATIFGAPVAAIAGIAAGASVALIAINDLNEGMKAGNQVYSEQNDLLRQRKILEDEIAKAASVGNTKIVENLKKQKDEVDKQLNDLPQKYETAVNGVLAELQRMNQGQTPIDMTKGGIFGMEINSLKDLGVNVDVFQDFKAELASLQVKFKESGDVTAFIKGLEQMENTLRHTQGVGETARAKFDELLETIKRYNGFKATMSVEVRIDAAVKIASEVEKTLSSTEDLVKGTQAFQVKTLEAAVENLKGQKKGVDDALAKLNSGETLSKVMGDPQEYAEYVSNVVDQQERLKQRSKEFSEAIINKEKELQDMREDGTRKHQAAQNAVMAAANQSATLSAEILSREANSLTGLDASRKKIQAETIKYDVKRVELTGKYEEAIRRAHSEEEKGILTSNLQKELKILELEYADKINAARERGSKIAEKQAMKTDILTEQLRKYQEDLADINTTQLEGLNKVDKALELANQKYELQKNKIRAAAEEERIRYRSNPEAQRVITKTEAVRLEIEEKKYAQELVSIRERGAKDERKNAKDRVAFYKELEKYASGYSAQLIDQNVIIDEQMERWRAVPGLREQELAVLEKIYRLEQDRTPNAGFIRATEKYLAEAQNQGKEVESIFSTLYDGVEKSGQSMWKDFLMTGKTSLDSLSEIVKSFIADISYELLLKPLQVEVVGSLSGVIGGMDLFGKSTAELPTAGLSSGLTGGTATGTPPISSGFAGIEAILGGMNATGNMAGFGNLGSKPKGESGSGFGGTIGNLPVGQLPGSNTLFGGITNSINNAMANWFPGTFSAATGTGAAGTNAILGGMNATGNMAGFGNVGGSAGTFTGTIAPYLGYGAMGSLGYSALGGALGLPQSKYSGLTSGVGGALGAWGGAALGGSSALAGAAMGSWLPGIGTAVGALAGGLLGGAFGGGAPKTHPGTWMQVQNQGLNPNADWAGIYQSGAGYWQKNNAEQSKPYFEQMGAITKETLSSVASFADMLPSELSSRLKKELSEETWSAGRKVKGSTGTWDFQAHDEEQLKQVIADATADIQRAVLSAFDKAAKDANLESLGLEIDTSSMEGLEKAKKALSGFSELTSAIEELKNPMSDIEKTAKAAEKQIADWNTTLVDLGWSQEKITEKTNEYRQALTDNMFQGIEDDIRNLTNPMSEIEVTAKTAIETLDDYRSAMNTLGVSTEQATEILDRYKKAMVDNLVGGINDEIKNIIDPLSDIEATAIDAIAQLEDYRAAMETMGVSAEEATSILNRYKDALVGNIVSSIEDEIQNLVNPLSDVENQVQSFITQLDNYKSAMDTLGVAADQSAALLEKYKDAMADNMFKGIGDAIANLRDPLSDIETQTKQVIEQLNNYRAAMEALGIETEEINKVLGEYRNAMIENVIKGIEDQVNPMSEYDRVLASVRTSIENHILSMRELGATEEQLAKIAELSAKYMQQTVDAMRQEFINSFEMRWANLVDDENGLKTDEVKRKQELQETEKKYGKDSWEYEQILLMQKAEAAQKDYNIALEYYNDLLKQQSDQQAKLAQLQEQKLRYEEQLKNLQQQLADLQLQRQQKLNEIQQKGYMDQINALKKQQSEAQKLADSWSKALESLLDARRDLWSSESNIDMDSREKSTFSDFNKLYEAAMKGDIDAANELAQVGTKFLDLKKQNTANAEEYLDAFHYVDEHLKDVAGFSDKQYDQAKIQVELLEDQIKELQKLYDALEPVDDSLKKIDESIANVTSQILAIEKNIQDTVNQIYNVNKGLDNINTLVAAGYNQMIAAMNALKVAVDNVSVNIDITVGGGGEGGGGGGTTVSPIRPPSSGGGSIGGVTGGGGTAQKPAEEKPEDMVRRVYRAVLGRDPDAQGLAFWSAKVRNNNWTYAELYAAAYSSSEFQQSTGGKPEGGGSGVTEGTYAQLNEAYNILLGRDIDANGLSKYRDKIASGWTLADVYADIKKTDEYKKRNPSSGGGSTSGGGQYTDPIEKAVSDAYYKYLGRAPDAEGLKYWTTEIKSGRLDVSDLEQIAHSSDEYLQGKRASGGPLTPGNWLVGEQGPEVVNVGTTGNVINATDTDRILKNLKAMTQNTPDFSGMFSKFTVSLQSSLRTMFSSVGGLLSSGNEVASRSFQVQNANTPGVTIDRFKGLDDIVSGRGSEVSGSDMSTVVSAISALGDILTENANDKNDTLVELMRMLIVAVNKVGMSSKRTSKNLDEILLEGLPVKP